MWRRGQSGNPGVRMRDKVFTDALRVAVNAEHEPGKKRIPLIAERLALAAAAGSSGQLGWSRTGWTAGPCRREKWRSTPERCAT